MNSTKSVFELKMSTAKDAYAKDMKALDIERSKYELLKERDSRGVLDKKDKERLKAYKERQGIIRTRFNPIEGKPDPMAWMGVKVLHKRTGRDTISFQKAYAMG